MEASLGELEYRRALIKDLEALTICWHSPPYNSTFINSYTGRPLRVKSWKNRGRLLPEFSSDWTPPNRPKEEE